jgi:nucleoid-associated protein YgaU
MAIYRGSRYEKVIVTNQIVKGRVRPTFRRRTLKPIVALNGVVHTWIQGDRLDTLAYKYYGDAQKWWVILDANPRFMTPFDIRPGDTLSIPSYQDVRRSLGL